MKSYSDAIRERQCGSGHIFLCAFPVGLQELFSDEYEGTAAVLNADQAFLSTFVRVAGDTVWLIEMYRHTCGPCRRFSPTWLTVGLLLRKGGAHVQLVSVNCDHEEDLCRSLGGSGVPRMMFSYSGSTREVSQALLGFAGGSGQAPYAQPASGGPVEGQFDKQHLLAVIEAMPEDYVSGAVKGDIRGAIHDVKPVQPCPQTREMPRGWPAAGWPSEPANYLRMREAAYAVVFTLKHWARPRVRPGKDLNAFFQGEGEVDIDLLISWVGAIALNFFCPVPELNELYQQLVQIRDSTGVLCVAAWESMLAPLEGKFPEPEDSPCKTPTCKIWTLIHVLSLAPLNNPGGALPPKDTLMAIENSINAWLACDVCRVHAREVWHRSYGYNNEVDTTPNLMPIWLWRFHSAVSVKAAAEGHCAHVDRRWPTIEDCPNCWHRGSDWGVLNETADVLESTKVDPSTAAHNLARAVPDERAVLEYLRREYWPQGDVCSTLAYQT